MHICSNDQVTLCDNARNYRVYAVRHFTHVIVVTRIDNNGHTMYYKKYALLLPLQRDAINVTMDLCLVRKCVARFVRSCF